MMTDPIADMLTRIRNAGRAGHPAVNIPASRVKREIARVLKEEGFIKEFQDVEGAEQGILRVYLKYASGKGCIIRAIQRVSKPGRRVYAKAEEIHKVLGGIGISILSTSSGVLSDREARKRGVGGEVLCTVW